MSSVICGSLAYDVIMMFDGRFRDHILPDQIHILNISFLLPEMRREFGGCAGNIAYSLKALGGDPLPMATVGEDAGPYLARFDALGIPTTLVRTIPGAHTAQAMVTSDLDNNQITGFHPGAMTQSHLNHIADAGPCRIGILAPDGREGMMQHAREFVEAGIPFIFDPGQQLPVFSGEELRMMVGLSTYLTVNDYEAKLLEARTGMSTEELAKCVEALIVTRGEHGAEIHVDGQRIDIPAVPPDRIVDPTGCGDAFRGGLLFGIEQGLDWRTTGRLASLMGSIKIAHQGPQTYVTSATEIADRFADAFGYHY